MNLRPDRRLLAVAILLCWAAGLVLLARRRHAVSEADLLATGALRIGPATYFYSVFQNGTHIGSASSSFDTIATGFRSREILQARALIAGDTQSVMAMSTAYLSRGFALDSFAMTVRGGAHPLRLHGIPRGRAGVLLPTLVPVALMVTREPRPGGTSGWWIYDPVSRRVERVTLTIAAESLFSVVDSAAFDSASHRWAPAHSDTVRAWKIETPSRSVSAWVDARGRLVSASEPGGASLVRTASEIAILNLKLPPN